MLENLSPAPKIVAPQGWHPAVEFDGSEGTAVMPPVQDDEKPDFDKFLVDAGFDPELVEIIGEPRTSRWQVARPFPLDPMWLTSYKFRFRKRNAVVDLPLLYSQVKKTKKVEPKPVASGKAFIILWSDLQVGKADHRGGTAEFLERIEEKKKLLLAKVKEQKPEKIVFCDVGDTIENFTNAADLMQLQTNTLSLMQQIDLATTLAWDILKDLSKFAPITYLSVGSNHCQWRVSKQRVGTTLDDWGIHIGRTLARLAKEVGLPIQFFEPQQHDESLCHDIFGDEFHVLGLWHGHQANRPDGIPNWWKQQSFGKQPVHAATIGVSGHFHHLRVQELGSTPRGTSRYWIQAATLDNGSGWFRQTSGEDSQPGLVCFALEKGKDFTGTVWKL